MNGENLTTETIKNCIRELDRVGIKIVTRANTDLLFEAYPDSDQDEEIMKEIVKDNNMHFKKFKDRILISSHRISDDSEILYDKTIRSSISAREYLDDKYK